MGEIMPSRRRSMPCRQVPGVFVYRVDRLGLRGVARDQGRFPAGTADDRGQGRSPFPGTYDTDPLDHSIT